MVSGVFKAVPLHVTKALGGGRRYSSYSFSTSTLDGGECSASSPGRALSPGKGPSVPIVQEAGWAPELVWTQRLEEKSFRLCRVSKLDRPVVQPVARHSTDWATWLKRCLAARNYSAPSVATTRSSVYKFCLIKNSLTFTVLRQFWICFLCLVLLARPKS
jgi:hypothetical protein